MSVMTMHGIAEDWNPNRQVDRNYVSRDSFTTYLKNRRSSFVGWSGPQQPEPQDVLTIDDSTMAAAAACMLARELNHQVMIFVNPLQILNKRPYYFSVLDGMLDYRSVNRAIFQGIEYSIVEAADVTVFRRAVRNSLMDLGHEDALDHLEEIASILHCREHVLPDHLQPIDEATLRLLIKSGVTIANHGWDHVSIRQMSTAKFRKHVEMGADWLKDIGSTSASTYAVPYGEPDLTIEQKQVLTGDYMLVSKKLPIGSIGGGLVNRVDITGMIRRCEV